DFATVFSHAILLALFSWLSMGYLRGAVIRPLGATDAADLDVTESPDKPGTHFSDVVADAGEPAVSLPDNRTVVEHLNASDESAVTNTEANEPATESREEWTWSNFTNSILPPAFTLGTIEVGVILGAMNLLFLSFVIVQIPYLFGGMDFVQTTPDFKLAEYARRGFGELVTVSALVLPMLLVGQWLIRQEARRAQLLFKVLASTQIALLFVIMASAVERLVILTGPLGYGMTTIRLYPMIFMSWLAVVFVWFGLTVLRGYRQHFAWGALWSAFVVLAATHVLNPDAFIVKTNLELMRQGRSFDAAYNRQLSDDAVPTLIRALDEMSETDRLVTFRNLQSRYCHHRSEDLRSWNLDRAKASAALAQYGDQLASQPCGPDGD
ncbi:MAG: DUF4173 domain-containing protein, partial [Acidobacteria bacterium]|nr:DUF4173 domain-containing protein [Acidobacteriota bacterium]